MESNKNNDNNKNEGDKQNQQLRTNALKRKMNELANDCDKPAAAGEENQQEPEDCNSKKNREEGNTMDLELESLSREELIKLIQTQMGMTMEAQKQLEAAKKEAEESANAKQQQHVANREIASKMEEFKRALLASQHKAQELTGELAKLNAEYQTLFKQIVQLPHEKEEEIAETEIQAALSFHQPMKIQLSKETWFEMLAFLPRHQLGQIVPQIGDRQFAGIAQSFLHKYGQITLGNIWIYGPDEYVNANGHLEVDVWPKFAHCNEEPWRTISRELVLPNVPMPENINDFLFLRISYLDPDVLYFLRQFHQNSLFGNVNLDLLENTTTEDMDMLLTTLSYVLPLIRASINSIELEYVTQLSDLYNANSDMTMAMLEMPRILGIFVEDYQFQPEMISLLKRWLYTPRDDGKPRMLILPNFSTVLHFIDNIQMEFSTSKSPVSFFIRLFMRDSVEWDESNIENVESKEKLMIKNVTLSDKLKLTLPQYQLKQKMALISRYPLNARKNWIAANEKEMLDWDFDEQNRKIHVDVNNPIKNEIPYNFEHSSEGREAHYRNIRLCDCFSSANDGRENQGSSRDNDGDQMNTFAPLAVANDQQQEEEETAEKEKDFKDQ